MEKGEEKYLQVTHDETQYEAVYEEVSRREEQKDKEELDFFSHLIPDRPGLEVLDLGCAEGKLAILLAKKGHDVVAADISANYLEQAKRAAKAQSVSIETIKCDIETDTTCFHGRKFDYILFMDVIEHLRSPIRGLENIRELLKEDGTLFIHTPNACSIPMFCHNLVNRKKVSNFLDPRTVRDLHLQLYDFSTLTKLCNFVGLKVIRIIPTKATLPKITSSRIIARRFPAICNTLLIECNKCQPIDIAEVVGSWVSSSSTKKE